MIWLHRQRTIDGKIFVSTQVSLAKFHVKTVNRIGAAARNEAADLFLFYILFCWILYKQNITQKCGVLVKKVLVVKKRQEDFFTKSTLQSWCPNLQSLGIRLLYVTTALKNSCLELSVKS